MSTNISSTNIRNYNNIHNISVDFIKNTYFVENTANNKYFESQILDKSKNRLNTYNIIVEKQIKYINIDKLYSISNADTQYRRYYLQILKTYTVTTNDIIDKIDEINSIINSQSSFNNIVITIDDFNISETNNMKYILLDNISKKTFIVNAERNIYNFVIKYFYPDIYSYYHIYYDKDNIDKFKNISPIKLINRYGELELVENSPTNNIEYYNNNAKHYIYIDIPMLISKLKELK